MTEASGRLAGKTAIVTGGTRGIGLAIARAMAQAGARVVVSSRREPGVRAAVEDLSRVAPGTVFGRACHVGREEDVVSLVRWVAEEVGLPDILVNNAGTNPYFGPMLGTPEAAWDKTFEVNLKGAFWGTREVAKGLISAERRGSIVNTSSILGDAAAPLQGAYGMTKAALISMTRTLAAELGPAGIRVNAIAPGLVDTKLASLMIETDHIRQRVTDRTAEGRHATPDEMAGAAVFLASDEASYVTGQTLFIDGGYSTM